MLLTEPEENVTGNKWSILFKYTKATCDIDLPFNRKESVNVIMGYRAESWNACKREATNYACINQHAKYLFWSKSPEPLRKNISVNCYLFRTCLVGNRATLIDPGNTYKLNEGKRRISLHGTTVY